METASTITGVPDGQHEEHHAMQQCDTADVNKCQIWFQYKEASVYTQPDIDNTFSEDGRFDAQLLSTEARRREWLQEIVDHKRGDLPDLTKVELEEKRVRVIGAKYINPLKNSSWGSTDLAQKSCDEAGIHLKVKVCIPNRVFPTVSTMMAAVMKMVRTGFVRVVGVYPVGNGDDDGDEDSDAVGIVHVQPAADEDDDNSE